MSSTSALGQIFLTGIVVLARPRSIDPQKGNRNIAFDVTLPVKDGREATLGLLRYFTPENRVSEFEKLWAQRDEFTEAFIVAKVCIQYPS